MHSFEFITNRYDDIIVTLNAALNAYYFYSDCINYSICRQLGHRETIDLSAELEVKSKRAECRECR